MPRRASSSLHPVWWIAAILLIIAAITSGHFIFKNASDPYRTTASLDTSLYLENANSLRGNTYRLDGTIRNFIKGTNAGRLFSIETSDQNRSVLPILVPSNLNQMNIQRGQRFSIRFEIDENGLLRVQELRKV